jgi:thiamine biosynthesis protein ThiS
MIRIGEENLAWHQGLTIEELLKQVENSPHVAVVRLNGKLVSRPNFATTVVPDQAEVILLPMIVGG